MIDLYAFLLSCLLVLLYYLALSLRTRKSPESSVHGFNAGIREQWVSLIIDSGNKDILAIQTLRNSVMAANFMASTSVLLIIGTLNLSEKIGNWMLDKHFFVPAETVSNDFWQIKLGLLLLDFFVAFYSFSMAIRFFNHVGYMINLPYEPSDKEKMHSRTCSYLNKAGSYYTVGNRAFFFSLPIIMWFFGAYFLVLSTLILIAGLAILDQAPR